MKFLNKLGILAALALTSIATPALAAGETSTVTLKGDLPLSLVTRASSPIAMAPLSQLSPRATCNSAGCHMGSEADPAVLDGAELCIFNVDENWGVRPDGTIDKVNPERAGFCSPIVNGRATVTGTFYENATPVVVKGDRAIAWVGRDRLAGLPRYTGS
jgi:hypothetical protein